MNKLTYIYVYVYIYILYDDRSKAPRQKARREKPTDNKPPWTNAPHYKMPPMPKWEVLILMHVYPPMHAKH